MEKILVTSALPYANGPLHVGHAAGAYVPADVYVRYQKMKGSDVIYICGTDEHGTPIAVAAEQEGIAQGELVKKYHKQMKAAFDKLGIGFDNFSGTHRDIHIKTSQDFFLEIEKREHIYEQEVERPYCPNCKRFLPDRYVRGVCPKCAAEDERGDQCEKCGKQLEPHELKKPYCIICKGPPEMRKTKHWFFKLSEFNGALTKWITKNRHWPDNARNFALGWLKEGLEDRAITRDIEWGVPVPVPGAAGKVLYVWFDAPIGYISATKEWAEREGKPDAWRDYWTGGTKIVHFIGKDNIPFHAIIWPAMLMAHGDYNLPWQIASNEYLTLDGRKMSTSRKWVLWLHDVLGEFDADALRYYLISIAPETSDSDFRLKDFQSKVNSELIGTLGNFINRTLMFIESKKGSIIPEPDVGKELLRRIIDDNGKIPENLPRPSESGIGPDLLGTIRDSAEIVGKPMDRFAFKLALSYVLGKSQDGNIFFQKNEPWKNENGTTLFLCANLCRSLAILMHPFMPAASERVWKMLALEGSVADQKWESAGELKIKPGHKIGHVEPLFKKIEDNHIEDFERKYLPKSEEVPAKFNLDIRVGKIVSVANHPNADKLYVAEVDIGEEKRQVVAGLKEHYTADELKDKTVALLANLKPAKIRGVESRGMILAADDGKNVKLLEPKGKPGDAVYVGAPAKAGEIEFSEFIKTEMLIENGRVLYSGKPLKTDSGDVRVCGVESGARVR